MSARLTTGATASHVWTRGASRRKKVLYVSSPIGLGHVRRDLAIASELRQLHPDIEIEWLAQDPVTAVLRNEGEAVHPASAWLASESAHIASEACGHDLHCFQALRSMDEILVANFMLFQEVIEDGLYDLVVGDEAWDVDHYWHENPELKRGAHVWMTDFVGYLPMPDGGDDEAFLTADYNAEMIEHISNFPRIRDRSIFVGNSADVVPDTFGRDLPSIRDWTEAHFDFSGYITGFTPPTPDQVAQWRSELGYGEDEQICIITVGGSGVGQELLEMAIAAHPIAGEPSLASARSQSPARASTPTASHGTPVSKSAVTSTASIATWRCATSPSCKAGSPPRWSSPPPSGLSSTSRSRITSSRTSTFATASTNTAQGTAWTTPPPTRSASPKPLLAPSAGGSTTARSRRMERDARRP